MNCQNCGNELEPTEVYCTKCGAPVGGEQANQGVGQQPMYGNMNMDSKITSTGNEYVNKAKAFLSRVSEKQNKTGLVAAIVMFVALFLPYAQINILGYKQSINYIAGGDGKIALVLLIAAGVAYYLKREGIGCVCSALILILALIDWRSVDKALAGAAGFAKTGIGCYLLILASLVMTIAPFISDKVEELIKKAKSK